MEHCLSVHQALVGRAQELHCGLLLPLQDLNLCLVSQRYASYIYGDYVTGQGTFYFIIINKHGDGLATFLMGFLQHAFKYIISHDPYKGSVKQARILNYKVISRLPIICAINPGYICSALICIVLKIIMNSLPFFFFFPKQFKIQDRLLKFSPKEWAYFSSAFVSDLEPPFHIKIKAWMPGRIIQNKVLHPQHSLITAR